MEPSCYRVTEGGIRTFHFHAAPFGIRTHLHNFSPFAPFLLLIEDPEGTMMRSIQWHPPPSAPHKPFSVRQHASKTRRRRTIKHHAYPPAPRRRRPEYGSCTRECFTATSTTDTPHAGAVRLPGWLVHYIYHADIGHRPLPNPPLFLPLVTMEHGTSRPN